MSAAFHDRSGCSGCGHPMDVFFELDEVPVNSCILVDSRETALAFPRAGIALGFCGHCGFVSNVAFRRELTEYSGRYEGTQGFSETFNQFHRALAQELVERMNLRNKTIVEIGCGKGEFLALLCRLGDNRGLGYDPSYDDERGLLSNVDARVVRDFFSERFGSQDADFVCCKMTLEHIPATARFVRAVRAALRPTRKSAVFFQVPEALRILRDCAFEDVYYEHCSYFTAGSLARLFRAQGFDVNRIERAYDAQYLTLEGTVAGATPRPPLPEEEPVEAIAAHIADFAGRFAAKVDHWRSVVEARSQQGPVVLWGSGSKAVSFLRAIQVPGAIEHVVDINPYRQGHFLPGSGQRIVAPAELARIGPRTIIAMNPVYREEIAGELDRLGVTTELLTMSEGRPAAPAGRTHTSATTKDRPEPIVGLGMPVFNGARYVAEAIESILGQSFSAFELVICDNASTDETEAICREFAAADPRVRYYRNFTNIGAHPNYNRTFALAARQVFQMGAAR